MSDAWSIFWVIALCLIAVSIYFYPATTALNRKNPNRTAIFVLNLVAGWTVIGWLAAVVWAYAGENYAKKEKHDRLAALNTMQCFRCAETIKSAALACRFCGAEVVQGSYSKTMSTNPPLQEKVLAKRTSTKRFALNLLLIITLLPATIIFFVWLFF